MMAIFPTATVTVTESDTSEQSVDSSSQVSERQELFEKPPVATPSTPRSTTTPTSHRSPYPLHIRHPQITSNHISSEGGDVVIWTNVYQLSLLSFTYFIQRLVAMFQSVISCITHRLVAMFLSLSFSI